MRCRIGQLRPDGAGEHGEAWVVMRISMEKSIEPMAYGTDTERAQAALEGNLTTKRYTPPAIRTRTRYARRVPGCSNTFVNLSRLLKTVGQQGRRGRDARNNEHHGCARRRGGEPAGSSSSEAYPLGYVEDRFEPRTKPGGRRVSARLGGAGEKVACFSNLPSFRGASQHQAT